MRRSYAQIFVRTVTVAALTSVTLIAPATVAVADTNVNGLLEGTTTGRSVDSGSTTTTGLGKTVEWETSVKGLPPLSISDAELTSKIKGKHKYVAGSAQAPTGWNLTYSTDGGVSFGPVEPPAGSVTDIRTEGGPSDEITQTLNQGQYAQPFQSTGSGDGWNVEFSKTKLFMINHHIGFGNDNWFKCYQKGSGNPCTGIGVNGTYVSPQNGAPWGTGPKTFMTPTVSSMYVDTAKQEIWTLGAIASAADTPADLYSVKWLCIDYNLQESCGTVDTGLTALSPLIPVDPSLLATKSTAPASYAGEHNGVLYGIGSDSKLSCLVLATRSNCSDNGLQTMTPGDPNAGSPYFSVIGSRLVGAWPLMPQAFVGKMLCFDLDTMTQCAGAPQDAGVNQTWVRRVPIPAGSLNNPTGYCNASSAGTDTGYFALNTWRCFNWDGTVDNTMQSALTATQASTSQGASPYGRSGSKTYIGYVDNIFLPNPIEKWTCFDYATLAACAGFTTLTVPYSSYAAYSLNVDPFQNDCVYENGDVGNIVTFGADTGTLSECGLSSTTNFTATPPAAYECNGDTRSPAYSEIQVSSDPSSLDSFITIRDATGTQIPGWNEVSVVANSLDISAIPYGASVEVGGATLNTTALQVTVYVPDQSLTSGPSSKATLIWKYDKPVQMCFQTVVNTLPCEETVSPISVETTALVVDFGQVVSKDELQVTTEPNRCAYQVTKSVNTNVVDPGGTVTYTIKTKNTGTEPLLTATWNENLTKVLDDAVFNNDAISVNTTGAGTVGALQFASPTLIWTGPLAVGQTVTTTFTVKVNIPVTGDKELHNIVTSPGCTDKCDTTTYVSNIIFSKRLLSESPAQAGEKVFYEITAKNTGQGATATSFTDNLTDVLDDAKYGDDAIANTTSGDGEPGVVTYAAPTLSWAGTLNPGQTVTILYSAKINDPYTGNGTLLNTVVDGTNIANCKLESKDPQCTAITPITKIEFKKRLLKPVDGILQPGETATYRITAENVSTERGKASWVDNLSKVLDDATYNKDAELSGPGKIVYDRPLLSWSGVLGPQETAVVTFTITADKPNNGDRDLPNVVIGTGRGSNCLKGSDNPECATTALIKPNPDKPKPVNPDKPKPVNPDKPNDSNGSDNSNNSNNNDNPNIGNTSDLNPSSNASPKENPAVTGSEAYVYGLFGLLLLAAGGLMIVGTRKRRQPKL